MDSEPSPQVFKHQKRPAEFYIEERCHITELLNAEQDPALSIAQARVEPGVTTAWHWVTDTAERYYILSGTGRVELGESLSEPVTSGDLVIIPANCRQRIQNTGENDLIFLAICTPRFQPHNYQSAE